MSFEHDFTFLEEWFEDLVCNRKGTVSVTHDYHSGTWTADYINKRKDLIASSVDEMGEGQTSVISALLILKETLQSRMLSDEK